MIYEFVSRAQLIFKCMAPGRVIQVNFSERDSTGTATFITSDDAVAQAIMSHSFFKKGRIQLVTAAPQTEAPAQEQTEIQDEAQEQTETTVQEQKDLFNETQSQDPQESDLTFPNITIAKDYLHRNYGVKKEDIRSMVKIQAFAQAHGLTITINADN